MYILQYNLRNILVFIYDNICVVIFVVVMSNVLKEDSSKRYCLSNTVPRNMCMFFFFPKCFIQSGGIALHQCIFFDKKVLYN